MKKSAKIIGWDNGNAQLVFKSDTLWSRLSHDSFIKLLKSYYQVFIGLASLVVIILLTILVYRIF